MSGPLLFGTPRRIRRGATLTLVFGTLLATGAAAGSLTETQQRPRVRIAAATAADPGRHGANPARTGAASTPGDAKGPQQKAAEGSGRAPVDSERIAQEIAQGKVGAQTVQKLVSRSGDRWSSFYTAQEYAGLQEALDGRYVGVGLWVRRIDGGRVQIARVQSGSPAQRAGVRVGDMLASIDSTRCGGLAVTEVVADLRGDNTPGSTVTLALQRGGRAWTVTMQRATLATEAVTVSHPGGQDGPTDIAIDAFTLGTGKQVQAAVRTAEHGVLLDLRGNSGGWSRRPSRWRPRSSTAAWSPPTTCTAGSRPSTRPPAATPRSRWWSWSTAAP